MSFPFSRRLQAFYLVIIITLLLTTQIYAAPLAQSVTPLTLPPGFRDTRVVGGLLAPRAFTFLPDGRILINETGKAGSDDLSFASIRVVQNGALLPERAWSVELCGSGEQGLLGIAHDPSFSSNGYVYIYYTAIRTYNPRTCVNQISRLTMSGNTLSNEKILVGNIFAPKDGVHNAGGLRFDSAGFLWATTGNVGDASLSGRTDVLQGRVLRIKPDTSTRGYNTTGNPFESTANARYCGATPLPSGTTPCREIVAWGLRNPYRFAIQPAIPNVPGTGSIWPGDVGDGGAEEINNVTLAGGDYGYPICEGPCNPPIQGKIQPIYWYPHPQGGGAAVVIGDFYVTSRNPNAANRYPDEYNNNLFFIDFVAGVVRRLAYDTGSSSWDDIPGNFATTSTQTLTDMMAGPNGDLYYVKLPDIPNVYARGAELRVIQYGASNNQVPEAFIGAPVLNCSLNSSCQVSAAGTFDPDNHPITNYNWRVRYVGDSSDTTTANTSGPSWSYTFTENRNATVTLRATDSQGGVSDPVTLTMYPGNQTATGTLNLQNMTDAGRGSQFQYWNGDQWSFAAQNITDPDGALPANPVFWTVVFHHNDHTHPFLTRLTAPNGSFTIDRTYHKDYRVWYRVFMNITDGRGQVTTYQRDVNPVIVNVTFEASLPNVQFIVDSVPQSLPNTTPFIVGTNLQIITPTTATYDGGNYQFTNWADGSTVSTRTVVIGASNVTYRAIYNSPSDSAPIRNRYTNSTPTLTWLPVQNPPATTVQGYEVQLSTSSAFSTLITVPNNPFNSSATSFMTPTLTPGVYYWRMRTRYANGTVSVWSGTEAFAITSS
jgi:glucose/arabinose dehydrogenase